MNLFNRFIVWLAEGIKPKSTIIYKHKGRVISRVHAVQMKRQKAHERNKRWWNWYERR